MNIEKLNYLSKYLNEDKNNCYSIIVSFNLDESFNKKQIKNYIYNLIFFFYP